MRSINWVRDILLITIIVMCWFLLLILQEMSFFILWKEINYSNKIIFLLETEKLNGKWNIHCLLRGPEASMESWREVFGTIAELPE